MKGVIFSLFIQFCLVCAGNSQIYSTIKLNYYSTENGLDATNVRKTIQDSMGFIWVATQDGLYRFDGNRFVSYNKSKPKKYSLTGVDIRDICIHDSILWSVNSYGGIDAIDIKSGSVIYQYNQRNDPSLKDVLFVTLTASGNNLFIGSNKGLFIMNLKTKKIAYYQASKKIYADTLNVNKLTVDLNGNLWIFCGSQGVGIISIANLQPIIFLSSRSLIFNDCTSTNDGVLAATNFGPRHFVFVNRRIKEQPSFDYLPRSLRSQPVYSINKEHLDKVWMSNKNSLLVTDIRLKKTLFISPSKLNNGKNWTSTVFGIFFDRDKNIWLSCQQGIALGSNKPSEFLCISKSNSSSVQINHAYFLYPDSDSSVLVCAEDGLYLANTYTKDIVILDSKRSYFYAFENFDKSIIVSNDEGTFVLRRKQLIPITKIYKEFNSFGTIIFNSKVQLSDSSFLLGSQNYKGVYIWNFRARTVVNISPHLGHKYLKDDDINSIYKEPGTATAWILSASSLFKYAISKTEITEVLVEDPETKEKITILYDLVKVRSNYYLATYGNGIVVLDDSMSFIKKITTRVGLTNDCVYKLLPYKDSLLFATTNNGLSVINLKDFSIEKLYTLDGIHSNSFEELSGNVRNDIIYIGGVDGMTIINPKLMPRNTIAPTLSINTVQIESTNSLFDTVHFDLQKVKIPNDIKQVKIFFSAISYSSPTGVTFRYKIKEIDPDWLSQGSQSFLTLIGLSPGTYHLDVQAFNKGGVPSEVKQLVLVFFPKWYQTWWFKLLITISVLGLIFGLYLIGMNQVKKEQQLKTRLASDLHDDLGSTMNSVKIYTHLALLDREQEKYLKKIEESTKEAIAGIKDMIWVLDESKGNIGDLLSRINLFAASLCEANNVIYRPKITDDARIHKLSQQEKRNLYMMIKETINNSIKYADAIEIVIEISVRNAKPEVSINDNGKGFELESIQRGNGLNNLYRRAKEIKYQVILNTMPGKGTAINFRKI